MMRSPLTAALCLLTLVGTGGLFRLPALAGNTTFSDVEIFPPARSSVGSAPTAPDCPTTRPVVLKDVPQQKDGKQHWAKRSVQRLSECPDPSQQQLKAMPTEVQVAGKRYRLEAFIWQDFMPQLTSQMMAKPKPMMASLKVKALQGSVPTALTIDRFWVIQGSQQWSRKAQEIRRQEGILELVDRSGPQWSPETSVEVIVQLRHRNGELRWLRTTTTIQKVM
ncbi:MAG: hypothetical protein VKJ24_07905 [Synechococcales bacterium]|nr:hypothetical protein [Synechococcales bacterium]